jgi:AcrR family transcriptional regulator
MPQEPLNSVPARLGRGRRLDRDALILAAAELTDRDGPEALTLAALATALGVKPPSLYAHISGLKELKTAVAALGLEELEDAVARSSIGKSGADAVKALCWAYRHFAERRPGVYLATVMWTPHDDPAVQAAGRALKETVLKILPRSKARTKFAEQIHLLRIFRITLHGYVALKMANAFGEPVDPDKTFERIIAQLTALANA